MTLNLHNRNATREKSNSWRDDLVKSMQHISCMVVCEIRKVFEMLDVWERERALKNPPGGIMPNIESMWVARLNVALTSKFMNNMYISPFTMIIGSFCRFDLILKFFSIQPTWHTRYVEQNNKPCVVEFHTFTDNPIAKASFVSRNVCLRVCMCWSRCLLHSWLHFIAFFDQVLVAFNSLNKYERHWVYDTKCEH